MNRTFNDMALSRVEREALYRRNAKIQRERDRFPFSNFDVSTCSRQRQFDAWLDGLPRDGADNPIFSRG